MIIDTARLTVRREHRMLKDLNRMKRQCALWKWPSSVT